MKIIKLWQRVPMLQAICLCSKFLESIGKSLEPFVSSRYRRGREQQALRWCRDDEGAAGDSFAAAPWAGSRRKSRVQGLIAHQSKEAKPRTELLAARDRRQNLQACTMSSFAASHQILSYRRRRIVQCALCTLSSCSSAPFCSGLLCSDYHS